ncbi:MAG: rhodanese domain protein [Gammaproteobacteria bacterium]|jgi:rhodanese-related sulfurtransferase|nr:rhodanese domain protein [Gammaproteobacteria bacterium]
MNHSPEFIALTQDAKSRIKEISIQELKQKLDSKQPVCLLDVRETAEFQAAKLPKAKHLSKGMIEIHIHNFAKKDDLIILYCGGGNRSALAADNLQKMGYSNVLSMAGGFKAWVNAGLPTEKP